MAMVTPKMEKVHFTGFHMTTGEKCRQAKGKAVWGIPRRKMLIHDSGKWDPSWDSAGRLEGDGTLCSFGN